MKQKKKLSFGDKIFFGANTLLMICVIVAMFYPFWYCIIVSFNDASDLLMGPLSFWPRKFSLENYKFLFQGNKFSLAIRNSILRTVLGTITHCAMTGAVAYGLSRPNLMFRKVYTTIFVITMYFSGGLIATYLLYRDIGLIDNFLVYIVPGFFGFYNCILFMSFYESIPASLEESARMDGAGILTVFIKIIFPVSKPIFATIALYCVVGQWNAWYDTVIFTKSDNLITLQSILTTLLQAAENVEKMVSQLGGSGTAAGLAASKVSPLAVRVAAMVITVFPIAMVYPFFQKYFVKGIMLGSVKE